jgi:hypothetical protein
VCANPATRFRPSDNTALPAIRHRIGIHAFKTVSLVMLAWLCLPIPMPFLAAPAVVCFVVVSFWLWGANLQKRPSFRSVRDGFSCPMPGDCISCIYFGFQGVVSC